MLAALRRFSDFYTEIMDYHAMQQPGDLAVTTGWKDLDEFYKVPSWPTQRALATTCPLLDFFIVCLKFHLDRGCQTPPQLTTSRVSKLPVVHYQCELVQR